MPFLTSQQEKSSQFSSQLSHQNVSQQIKTSCQYGSVTNRNGTIQCKTPNSLFLKSGLGIIGVFLLISITGLTLRWLSNSKCAHQSFSQLIHTRYRRGGPTQQAPRNVQVNNRVVSVNSAGESIIDDSAVPKEVPRYTVNVDPSHDFGYYDLKGNLIVIQKPEPSHTNTKKLHAVYTRSASPQYIKDPPSYQLLPPAH